MCIFVYVYTLSLYDKFAQRLMCIFVYTLSLYDKFAQRLMCIFVYTLSLYDKFVQRLMCIFVYTLSLYDKFAQRLMCIFVYTLSLYKFAQRLMCIFVYTLSLYDKFAQRLKDVRYIMHAETRSFVIVVSFRFAEVPSILLLCLGRTLEGGGSSVEKSPSIKVHRVTDPLYFNLSLTLVRLLVKWSL